MISYNKDEITVVLPCYNEGHVLKSVIESFQKAGFKNILVVDDASRDGSGKIAEALNVTVVTNYRVTTLGLATLKGIYNVETPYSLVAYHYEEIIDPKLLEQFVEFGVIGNYSLLISKDESKKSKVLTSIIKKKFGMFLEEPLFDVMLLDSKLVSFIKRDVGGTSSYFYFEILKTTIDHKLKIGSYSLGLSRYKPVSLLLKIRMFLRIYRNENPETYFKYTVPDIDKKEIKKQLIIAIFGYVIIRIIEVIISHLPSLSNL